MKLTEQELIAAVRIKTLLETGCSERADSLAKDFLEGAKRAAAIKRRAYLLLKIAPTVWM